VPEATIASLAALVHGGFEPDLTVLLDAPVATGLARAHARNGSDGPDRFETERSEFFERVRANYLERARREPARIRVVDATGDIDTVARGVESLLAGLLGDAS
jgi:dTMP kinase